jgi:hypothetical protein
MSAVSFGLMRPGLEAVPLHVVMVFRGNAPRLLRPLLQNKIYNEFMLFFDTVNFWGAHKYLGP